MFGGVASISAQSPAASIQYVYDERGQLTGVVDQQGNVAVYVYDAVGNLLAIQRVNADDIPGTLGITLVSPNRGRVGAAVQIFGKGFSETIADNTVRFNGTLATATQATPNRLLTSVPAGATTGPITVSVAGNTANSPTSFTVGGVLTVTPTTGTIWVNGTLAFTAAEDTTPTSTVTWAVNGITDGGADVGTVSTAGVYTAPARVSSDTEVTVTATHANDRSSSANATVTVLAPTAATATTSVSVAFTEAYAQTVNQSVAAHVSAALAESATTFESSPNVSAMRAEPLTTFEAGAAVSSSREPVITAVSPTSASRGATNVTVTVTGAGLGSAASLEFLATISGTFTADSNITVTNLSANPEGTQATATVNVGSTAVLGGHVVRIDTGGVASTRDGTGVNVFTVNP